MLPPPLVVKLLFWAVDFQNLPEPNTCRCARGCWSISNCEVVIIQLSTLFQICLFWRRRDVLTSSHCNTWELVWFLLYKNILSGRLTFSPTGTVCYHIERIFSVSPISGKNSWQLVFWGFYSLRGVFESLFFCLYPYILENPSMWTKQSSHIIQWVKKSQILFSSRNILYCLTSDV